MFKLPDLPYSHSDLEPYMDTKTMQVHHLGHHQTYVNNLNAVLEKHPEYYQKTIEEIMKELDSIPKDIQVAVRNNGGGHYNHSFFWKSLSNDKKRVPGGALGKKIDDVFGDFETFKREFTKAAISVFGSGWAWLVSDEKAELSIVTTANQESPVSYGQTLLICIDLWEHAYYLKYQNKRAEYIENWWYIVNWNNAEEIYKNAETIYNKMR